MVAGTSRSGCSSSRLAMMKMMLTTSSSSTILYRVSLILVKDLQLLVNRALLAFNKRKRAATALVFWQRRADTYKSCCADCRTMIRAVGNPLLSLGAGGRALNG